MNNETEQEPAAETVDYIVTVERRYGPASDKERGKSYNTTCFKIYEQTFAFDPTSLIAHAANAPVAVKPNS